MLCFPLEPIACRFKYDDNIWFRDATNLLAESGVKTFNYSDLYSLPNLSMLFLTDTGIVYTVNDRIVTWTNLADTARNADKKIKRTKKNIYMKTKTKHKASPAASP